jgi:hypothetical protein
MSMLIRTTKTRRRLSRRAFLRGVGASAALLPMLEGEWAQAAATGPKRLITIAWANGVAQPSFYPAADDPTANTIMQPLAALKSKVTMVCGLDYQVMLDDKRTYDGHFTFPTMFTGTYKNVMGQNGAATGPSIDQVVSTAVAKTVNLPIPLLTIAAQGKSASFRMDGTINTAETKVDRLYKTLFSGVSQPMGQVSTLSQRRKSVIDYLVPELTGFGARRGTEDKAKITAHLDSIRQLEKGLTASSMAGAGCAPVDPGAPTAYQDAVKAFSDMIAMALRCDVTRTVAITWADNGGSGPYTMPFLNLGGTTMMDVGEVHGIAHEGASGYPKKIKIDTWYMQQLAYLGGLLDATMEGTGTMLDNSLIACFNDMTEGSFHSINAVPVVLVGSAGGALRTGRTVKVGSWATKTGNYWSSGNTKVAHNRLLASISNFMDVPSTGFGTTYTGTLTELA